MAPKLSIVLPGYNEQSALAAALAAYRRSLADLNLHDYELVVVDDGSTDGTAAAARQLAARDSRIRVLSHPSNRGQVAAILSGFRAARGEIVTHNGIDLPFDPRDTAHALNQFADGADVVVVERRDRQAYGWRRKLLSRVNLALLQLLFRSPVRDHNFVQFFRRDVLRVLPVSSRGVSTVTTELILRAARRGFWVARVTAEYHPRRTGRSTVTPSKVFRAFVETLRLRWWLATERIGWRPSDESPPVLLDVPRSEEVTRHDELDAATIKRHTTAVATEASES